jgi:hypothetical protein
MHLALSSVPPRAFSQSSCQITRRCGYHSTRVMHGLCNIVRTRWTGRDRTGRDGTRQAARTVLTGSAQWYDDVAFRLCPCAACLSYPTLSTVQLSTNRVMTRSCRARSKVLPTSPLEPSISVAEDAFKIEVGRAKRQVGAAVSERFEQRRERRVSAGLGCCQGVASQWWVGKQNALYNPARSVGHQQVSHHLFSQLRKLNRT